MLAWEVVCLLPSATVVWDLAEWTKEGRGEPIPTVINNSLCYYLFHWFIVKNYQSLGWGCMENKQEEIEGSKETTHLGWGAWCHAEIYKVALTRPVWEVVGCEFLSTQLCWSCLALLCTKLKRPLCFWNQLASLDTCTNVCTVLVNWLWKPLRDGCLDSFLL